MKVAGTLLTVDLPFTIETWILVSFVFFFLVKSALLNLSVCILNHMNLLVKQPFGCFLISSRQMWHLVLCEFIYIGTSS